MTPIITFLILPIAFSMKLASSDETASKIYQLCSDETPTVLRETTFGTFDIKTPESTRYVNCTWIINSVDYQRELNFYFTKLSTERNPDECIDKITLSHNQTVVKEACGETLPKDMVKGREFVITQKAKSDPISVNFETDVYPNLMGFEGFELKFQEKKSKSIFDTRMGEELSDEELEASNSGTIAFLVIGIIALLILSVVLFIKFKGADRTANIFKSRVNEMDDTYPNVNLDNINSSRYRQGDSFQAGTTVSTSRFDERNQFPNSQNISQGIYGGPIVRQSTEQTEILQSVPLVHAYGDGEEVFAEFENRPDTRLSQSTGISTVPPTYVSGSAQVLHSTALTPTEVADNLERSRLGTLPADSEYASFSRPLPEVPEIEKQEIRNDSEPENDYVTQEEIEQQRNSSKDKGDSDEVTNL